MKKVQVLLSSYHGEKYIKEQIESIIKQEEVEVSLKIRDDGSSDKTIEIIEDLAKENSNIIWYKGENIGPARSFMDLILQSDEADYYAFADQDDIWKPRKLISAIKALEGKEEIPALYLSALEIVDKNLQIITTKKVTGNFCLEGELAKNFATGCTQVFNQKLCHILKQYQPSYLIMHDSWITRVCYAIGGTVIVDENSYIQYRQHENNVVGYNDENFQKLKRQLKIAFQEKVRMRVNIAKELKNGYEKLLTKETKEILDLLISYPNNKKAKKWLLHNKKFRTNNPSIDMKIKIAILLNKF